MKSDIEIAQSANKKNILEIADKLGLKEEELEIYGKDKAKINFNNINLDREGNLILVTAINPTPAGEGKTTTSIGLADSLQKLGLNVCLALREPSLGPCFGIKGGACGGGYAQVIPMEDINLHFTGDMHAITSAHNLLAALIDNSIHHGNPLEIDINRITWKRVVDLNDRALREVKIALGGYFNGIPRESGFDITVASEIMACLCLAKDLNDLKERFAKIIIGYNISGEAVYVKDLKAEGAMAVLMKDAIKPNLVQTLEHTPTLIHGGPFANIAHGCNSLIATKTALALADYVVTEAGFGADLGAEKFFNIKSRVGNLKPKVVILVATIRALKMHGGLAKEELNKENLEALTKGIPNLEKHIENIKKYNLPIVVAINKFETDTESEINLLEEACKKLGVEMALSEVFAKGSEGGMELAKKVVNATNESKTEFKTLYDNNLTIKEKIEIISKEIYGASEVSYTEEANKNIELFTNLGHDKIPICIAKTPYSLSDDDKKIGRPDNFNITIREVRLSAGAGFIIAMAGKIMTMPGLPKDPAANHINIDKNGRIEGLF